MCQGDENGPRLEWSKGGARKPPVVSLPLKNTTFQLLGNMGYMSVKD